MVAVTSSPPLSDHEQVASRLFRLSIGVFFTGGFLTSSVSLLVPQLKLMLDLDYKGALLVQLAFHSSYMLFALPITWSIVRAGYMRAIVAGLAVITAGCLALTLAQNALSFAMVLGALLLVSAGQTFLQIASNTVVAVIGPSRGAARRLTLLQGFNSFGTVLGPLLSAPLLLGELDPQAARHVGAALPFTGTALVTGLLAFAYFRNRALLEQDEARRFASIGQMFRVMRSRRLRWGAASIFVYVGAEVAIGALLPTVLMRPDRLDAAPVLAGQLVSLYWGGAMVGRFLGAWAMQRIAEARLLMAVSFGAAVLTTAAIVLPGVTGACALLAVGLCNAIMYPTIYALALPEDERQAPVASMWLCMAVVGGAIVPLLTGALADATALLPALILPAACYAFIARFAALCARPQETRP
ncbi:MFS transporter [Sphingobium fuliginis]|uniref:Predicted glucose transporter in beta-glucoside utilization gene cluster n=1 Tax=Sphingobium fuliginis (strain ATCC 27551) TaxID=336203 RepID=A0A292ZL12_SPHSA|nr:MFS transporter [Sphingobium fuliginis]GAY23559.1 predicted glucose transporter in beta-glucoside utilization gene cluster [Sphingobium fuliginis]